MSTHGFAGRRVGKAAGILCGNHKITYMNMVPVGFGQI